ncbi:hypothetical protein [Nocardia altamirensis]|uniref:hypothetical protein n=1 Tax=Nocardia altamirensis TaxID=472158 RepID=UPI00083FF297|nr:hypothetical protein [Nocardia altamirensis]
MAAAGLIGAATAVPAAAAPAEVSPVPVTPVYVDSGSGLLAHVMPTPLACLMTTGFALWCVGIT